MEEQQLYRAILIQLFGMYSNDEPVWEAMLWVEAEKVEGVAVSKGLVMDLAKEQELVDLAAFPKDFTWKAMLAPIYFNADRQPVDPNVIEGEYEDDTTSD